MTGDMDSKWVKVGEGGNKVPITTVELPEEMMKLLATDLLVKKKLDLVVKTGALSLLQNSQGSSTSRVNHAESYRGRGDYSS